MGTSENGMREIPPSPVLPSYQLDGLADVSTLHGMAQDEAHCRETRSCLVQNRLAERKKGRVQPPQAFPSCTVLQISLHFPPLQRCRRNTIGIQLRVPPLRAPSAIISLVVQNVVQSQPRLAGLISCFVLSVVNLIVHLFKLIGQSEK